MTRIGAMLLAVGAFVVVLCGGPAAQVKADGPKAAHVGFRKFILTYRAGGEERRRAAFLWYPTPTEAKRYSYGGQVGLASPDADVATGRHPLIVFSHGFLGFGDQTIFLTEGLARRGYVVAALDHADSLRTRKGRLPQVPNFADAKTWDDGRFRDRREDMAALIDHLLAQNRAEKSFLHRRIDEKAVGGIGHSLGGYTMLGMAGARATWRDDRVRAVLALSPYTLPYLTRGQLADVKVPVMLQGGTLDFGITPLLPRVYAKLAGPKYHLVLKNETHFSWTNLISLGRTTTECVQSGNAELMMDYAVGFFERHLRGSEADFLEKKNARLHSYERQAK